MDTPLLSKENDEKTLTARDASQPPPKKQKSTDKPKRKRHRHHYNAIREQIEFYFGDANLTKDRFLKKLVDADPFVPLETFLTFNKLKALTSSVQEIAKSLSNSTLLELDKEGQKVRRTTALPKERNVDEKTLYVESLPSTADHDWVRNVFERFGAVSYVSLPKYAKSHKIKEFGFIEFEEESSVNKAVNAFKEFNGVLSMQDSDPSELMSVKTFIKEQQAADTELPTKDLGTRQNVFSDEDEPKAKKNKIEVSDTEKSTPRAPENNESSGSETDSQDLTDSDKPKQAGEKDLTVKKKRRKKKKSKVVEKRKIETDFNPNVSYYELKILPKRDWKRLRNKYLNLQREKVAELKRKAWKERQVAQQQQEKDSSGEKMDTVASPPSKKLKTNERKLHKMNMNFYGAGGEDEPQLKAPKDVKHKPALFIYEPGIIVEVGFLEPCVNVKEFKADMRQYEAVKYIDVKEGAMQAQLRLESADATENFVRQINCAEYKCKILSGESEKDYWKKIENDREMKLNKKVKIPQKRGREKVKKLVTKHIRFGDMDD